MEIYLFFLVSLYIEINIPNSTHIGKSENIYPSVIINKLPTKSISNNLLIIPKIAPIKNNEIGFNIYFFINYLTFKLLLISLIYCNLSISFY